MHTNKTTDLLDFFHGVGESLHLLSEKGLPKQGSDALRQRRILDRAQERQRMLKIRVGTLKKYQLQELAHFEQARVYKEIRNFRFVFLCTIQAK